MLNDLLARFGDEAAATETILSLGDLTLFAALRKSAEVEGMDLGTFVTSAVQRYTNNASDEEWIALMGVLGQSADPGLAFIRRALSAALTPL